MKLIHNSKKDKQTSELSIMHNVRKVVGMAVLVISALVLSGCGGSDIDSGEVLLTCNVPNVPDSSGTSCVPPPPINCPAPTVPNATNDACVVGFNSALPDPVFFPAENQAVLYYNRADVDADNSPNDPAYTDWTLYTWNNEECDALETVPARWEESVAPDGMDPTYGVYWILDLKEGFGECHNFIIKKFDEKEMGGADFKASLIQDDERFSRMNFTISGEPTVFEFPLDSLGEQPVKVEGSAAHWLDPQTLLWNVDFTEVNTVKLHYSADANIEITLEDGVLNSTTVELTEVDLTDEQAAIAPWLSGLPAFAGDWTDDDAKAVLKTQAILGAYDIDGKLISATRIQTPNVLDQLYTTGENDADEAQLGVVYSDDGITANLWAPTAQNVSLKIHGADKRLVSTNDMSYDDATGIWSYTGGMELDRQLFRYEVTVFHYHTDELEVLDVTDPYSVGLSANGRFSQFVNLNDEDLKPDGWETHMIPTVENFEDIVIYEGHIREFSVRDQSTSEANRGKYLAFTEADSLPMQHLQTLAEKGVTHFHVLPANDLATVNEDPDRVVGWTSTVQEFCALAPAAGICNDNTDLTQTFEQLFNSINVLTNPGRAQEITNQIRGFDSFNWGYDPKHFNAPDGSYASNADGVSRIIEMRSMIQALHETGLRVALDVVYNHTSASKLFDNSVFDKVVPGYYHRYSIEDGSLITQSCCDDTETRNRMMEKFMIDSVVMWAEQYKFDSFRFDIMSQHSKDNMLKLADAVRAIDPDSYIYGEGWGKDKTAYGDFVNADQINMAGTEISTFNDRFREAIRKGNIFAREVTEQNEGEVFGDQDRLKMSMAGNLTDYVLRTSGGADAETRILGGYSLDPADNVNYISKHDNETLWDQFNYVLPADLTLAERVRAQNVAHAITMVSQGIPFLQVGGDFLRSKSMDRDSFDSGDWFNFIDFTMETNNFNVGLPPADKNEGRWTEISQFMNSPERAASMNEIEFAAEVFQEYLSLRFTSPLFRLTTADDIKARIGFHNVGEDQQQGLVAMSIDDGINESFETQLTDLDPNHDAIMVVVNTGYEEKSIEVLTAAGFDLHPILMSSVDPTIRGASFTDTTDGEIVKGMFTVPALSVGVFVKNQGGERGYGLASFATTGAPDIVPYGDTVVYLRGGFNDWGTGTPMEYKGDGVYEAEVDLTAGETYAFKIAEADWGTPNLGHGGDSLVEEGVDKVLVPGGGDLTITVGADASYIFSLDATDTEAPILNVVNEEPYVGTPVYVRGGFNDWGTGNELLYQGDRIYTANIAIEANTYEFKIANADWDGPNLGAASSADADRVVNLGEDLLLFPTNDNLLITIDETGNYVFIFDSVNLDEPKIRVFAEEFFGSTAAYIRGGFNDWGTGSQLIWNDGAYSVDIDVTAGSYEFKVASEDWATINFGADEVVGELGDVSVDQPFRLFGGNNPPNLTIDFNEDGIYEFKVEGPDGNKPDLTVTKKD